MSEVNDGGDVASNCFVKLILTFLYISRMICSERYLLK